MSFTPLPIPAEIRFQHLYIPGKSGYGKSTLMHYLALQDIKKGRGVCVIDPKGDLVNQLIHWIPEDRKDDCIFLDTQTPVPIDFMGHHGDKDGLVSDLKFLLLHDQANAPRMEAIIIDLLYSLLSIPGTSFLDVYKFFRDENRQKEIIRQLPNPDLKARWTNDFPRRDEYTPILSRMTKFVRNPVLNAIMGSSTGLSIERAVEDGKIILVNLGGMNETTMLFGGLIFSKIKNAIFARHAVPPAERKPFYLYIDEFHKFQNPETFEDVLTMARGYRLSLTLANPTIKSLDEKVRNALGIISSYIVFSLSSQDAPFFKHILAPFSEHAIVHMPKFHAIYKIGDDRARYKATPPQPPHTSKVGKASYAEYIRKRMVDNLPSQSMPNMVQSKKDEPDDSDDGKPTLLPDAPKAKRAGESGEV